MSIPTDLMLDQDRDCLLPTSRDAKPEQSPDTTFKVPYPCNSHKALKATHTGLFQPIPRRVPALYQPWLQTQTSTWTNKPQTFSIFREHRAWEERRERKPLYFGSWDNPHYHSPFAGNRRADYPPGIHPDHFNHLLKWKPVPPETEIDYGAGIRHRWEASMLREHLSLNTERLNIGRHRGPYMKRRDKQVSYSHTGPISRASFNTNRRSHSCTEDSGRQAELMYKHSTTGVGEHPSSRRSSLLHSSPSTGPGDSLNEEFTSTGVLEDVAEPPVLLRPPAPSSTSTTSSSSPATVPWLLPHFAAGSLIELRDGRLRRVEDLKTEDFLLGSLACPQLRLSCCTVQNISPSATNASFSHLLILLHDQHSQVQQTMRERMVESVDVYAEYPFFVRGQGWSSCSPQGTTRLCGLQCRQLSVGDVCLALTPVSPNGFP